MKNTPPLFLFFTAITFLFSCQDQDKYTLDESYLRELEAYHNQRFEQLKKPNSWAALAGLFKLQEGVNTFGSGPENDLVFPTSAPAQFGSILLEKDTAIFQMAENILIHAQDTQLNRTGMTAKNPQILSYESFSWYVLERGEQYFLRLWDSLAATRLELTPIPRFPVESKFVVQAKFTPFDTPKTLPVRNVLEMDIDQEIEGKLQFEINGQTEEIWPISAGEEYFLIFADLTTGEETYGGGRYLYVPKADANGYTTIDFNKAYNPPCVFTKYATCLLPPVENRLEVAIHAGEKMYGEMH